VRWLTLVISILKRGFVHYPTRAALPGKSISVMSPECINPQGLLDQEGRQHSNADSRQGISVMLPGCINPQGLLDQEGRQLSNADSSDRTRS
jgi:hypothetical protein